jgi:hypothetical protein
MKFSLGLSMARDKLFPSPQVGTYESILRLYREISELGSYKTFMQRLIMHFQRCITINRQLIIINKTITENL